MRDRLITDRMNRGLSQQGMADLIGVSVDVIRSLEATGNRPRWANARKVAEFYGTTVVSLWPPALDEDEASVAA